MQDFLIIENTGQLKITALKGTKTVARPMKDFINEMMLMYGSSLKGRKDSFYHLTGCRYKIPLVFSNRCEIYFIITRSLDQDDCVLINYQKLAKIKRINDEKTLIIFKNGYRRELDVNYRILKRQVHLIEIYRLHYDCFILPDG